MKRETAEEITNGFIAALESGTVPWKKPWSGSGEYPRNYYSGHEYRGINTLILGMTAQAHGYNSPCWTTYKAAEQRGAYVRKGERSTKIIFWKPIKVEDRATGEDKMTVVARLYSVFNTDQIDGIDYHAPDLGDPINVPDALDTIVAEYPDSPSFHWVKQDRAYYRPGTDSIHLPLLEQFETVEGYAETLLHEMTHSTGHAKRLRRFEIGDNFDGGYAKEELVAEIGAAMLMQHAGITVGVTDNTAAYVANWLSALQNDHTLIIKAAQAAQKSCDHILSLAGMQEVSDAA